MGSSLGGGGSSGSGSSFLDPLDPFFEPFFEFFDFPISCGLKVAAKLRIQVIYVLQTSKSMRVLICCQHVLHVARSIVIYDLTKQEIFLK